MHVLHQVLISRFAELDQIRLDAVHLLVDLPVVGRLLLQLHLQVALAVHNLTYPGLQLVIVPHDPVGETAKGHYVVKQWFSTVDVAGHRLELWKLSI